MARTSATPVLFYEYIPHDISATEHSGWRPTSESHPSLADSITTLRLITWNIWFDKLEQKPRFLGTLRKLLETPSVDIVSLQEVTPQFIHGLQSSTAIRTDWLLTDCWDADHQREIPPKLYGNIFLVRRKWAGNVRGWAKKFPTSTMGRFVVMAEVFQGTASVVFPFMGMANEGSNC
jgi:hypothetical protein